MSIEGQVVVAADPGIEGAFATFVDGALVSVDDMPTLTHTVSGRSRRYVSPDAVDGLLRALMAEYALTAESVMFVLEKVGVRPKEGAVGAFSFGKGVGVLEGVVTSLRLPRMEVTPAVWKKDLKLKKDKDHARQRAMELYPQFREQFTRKKDADRAEAVLIGHWYVSHGDK